MDPIRFAIDNRVKVTVGVILLLLFGVLALRLIPVQLTPDTDATVITVNTEWTGRSPEEIEREILEEQEDVLKNVRNLKKMIATASQGSGEIELEFTIGTDLQSARVEVSDSLREVSEYPDDAEEPVITTGEAGAGSPIAWLLLTADTPGFDVQQLGDPAEERIKPFLERVPGVSEVRVYGGRAREVHIDFDPVAVAQRRITFEQLGAALRGENVNVSAGDVKEGRYDVRIRTTGEYTDLQQVRDTVVAYDDAGGPIRIKDLAEVSLGFEKRRGFVRSRGQRALALPVYKESGANVIEVMEGVRQRVDEVNAQVMPAIGLELQRQLGADAPPRFTLEQVYDETGYIYDALALVQGNLVIGGVLAVIALLVFLELGRRPRLVLIGTPILLALMVVARWLPEGPPTAVAYGLLVAALGVVLAIARPTLIIAFAIPISVIGTFVVLAAFGRNINVISLAGLAFAVGMVVDNAIVVLENIDRHLSMGKPVRSAAYDGTQEVWGAVLASTLTTLAVFIPVLTIQEEAGQLFRDIALAICAAVSLSLLVSITVIPSAAARLLRPRGTAGVDEAPPEASAPARAFGALAAALADLIRTCAQPGPAAIAARAALITLFTGASLLGAYLLMPPTDYLPRGNKNLVFGIVLTPPGFNIQTNEAIGVQVESVLRPYWEARSDDDLAALPPVNDFFSGRPVEGIPPLDNYFFVSFGGTVFNGATSADKNNVGPIESLLSSATSNSWGFGFAQQSSLFGRGATGSRQIDVEISGNDLSEVRAAGESLLGTLRERYGFPNVRPTPLNFDKAARELRVELDRVKAAELGIDVRSLGGAVSAMVDGVIVGDYRLGGEAIDVVARRQGGVADSLESLRSVPLAYRAGDGSTGVVPLWAVADVRRTVAPQQIRRIEERRAVTLEVTPPDEVPLEAATEAIGQIIRAGREAGGIKPTVEIALAGSASKLQQVREQMLGSWHGWTLASLWSFGGSRLFLALLVTYLLMAALFESFVYPLVILFAVPLAAVGGFLGLAVVHAIDPTQQLDTLTMLGFVILIGVVVNNAILLVHQSLNFMRGEQGAPPMGYPDAIRESVRTRIRPIFMTTATSVAGMLPLVLTPGSGSELYKGLGSVVVGGLVVSTVFTLVVVPLLLSLVMQARAAVASGAMPPGRAAEPAAEPV